MTSHNFMNSSIVKALCYATYPIHELNFFKTTSYVKWTGNQQGRHNIFYCDYFFLKSNVLLRKKILSWLETVKESK